MTWPPAVVRVDEIVATDDEQVLAVDMHGDYAAAFSFGVASDGTHHAAVSYARRTAQGVYDELGDGGWSGGWPTTPWRPPIEGWDGQSLLFMGSGGLDVEDGHENTLQLLAISGFATRAVADVVVNQDGRTRSVSITSPVGAFVVVTVGVGDITVRARYAQRDELAQPEIFEGWRPQPEW